MDIALQLNENNEADIAVQNGYVELDSGLTTAISISLFGGNIDTTAWWGNELDSNTASNLSNEFLQWQGRTLTSASLSALEEDIKENLAWLTTEQAVDSYSVSVSILAINKVQIDITINDSTLTFFANLDANT